MIAALRDNRLRTFAHDHPWMCQGGWGAACILLLVLL